MIDETRPSGHRPVKDLPRNNRAQNKQVNDAAKDEHLTSEERYILGEIIENETREKGINHDYHTIRRVAREINRGRK